MSRSVFSQTIPRQHGAWSILAAACLLGIATAGRLGVESILFVATVLLGFLAQHTAEQWLKLSPFDVRRRPLAIFLLTYTIACGLLGAILLIGYQRWGLIPLAGFALAFLVLSLFLAKKRKARSAAGEIVSVLGLTLVLPAAAYCAGGRFSQPIWGITVLSALFFCGSIFHVRYLVRGARQSAGAARTRLEAGWLSLAYHTFAPATAAALGLAGYLPLAAVLALAPASAKAFWAVARRRRAPLAIRTLGYIELAHTVLFVALARLLGPF